MTFTIRVGQHLNYISYGCCECFINFTENKSMISGIPRSNVKRPYFVTANRQKISSNLTMKHQRKIMHSYANENEISRSLTLKLYYIFLIYFLISPLFVCIIQCKHLVVIRPVDGCRPGSYASNRLSPRKLVPLRLRQHVPNVSEKTIGASGPSDGKIVRNSKRFREELMRNLNSNIFFKDEERTSADRMMTERCKDRLDRLAIMVSEHWKNKVKLRVIEAWDEDGDHEENSLHYEGRAVDITTTDKNQKKYGMLARLAVEAGFDWVFYESRSHVHCSVKADNSDAAIYGGCFAGSSYLTKPDGSPTPLFQAQPGDDILTIDSNGRVVPDKILTFLHWTSLSSKPITRTFKQLVVDNGNSITLTSNHLIKVLRACKRRLSTSAVDHCVADQPAFTYANNVRRGDLLIGFNAIPSNSTSFQRVDSVKDVVLQTGVYAPLTTSGTVLVNDMLASCYAVIGNHDHAHTALSPMRYYYILKNWFYPESPTENTERISWYSKFLFYTASCVLSETSLYI